MMIIIIIIVVMYTSSEAAHFGCALVLQYEILLTPRGVQRKFAFV